MNERQNDRQTPPNMPPQHAKGNPYFSNKYVRDVPLSERKEVTLTEINKRNDQRMRRQAPPPPPRRDFRPPMPVIPPEMRQGQIPHQPIHRDEQGKSQRKGNVVSAGAPPVMPRPEARPKQKKPAVRRDQETTLASYENNRDYAIFKAIMAILFLFIASTGLSFLRFKLPFLPSFLEVEFSIVPEFICVVFFGPLVGSAVVVLKNLAHMVIYTIIIGAPSYVSELSNVLTDLIFIFFAYVIFRLAIKNEVSEFVPRSKRINAVAIGGIGSSFLTAVLILPFDYFVIYPLFIKYFQHYGVQLDIMSYYLEKLPSLVHLWQGILIFNFPWEFGKLLAVTLIAVGSYSIATINE